MAAWLSKGRQAALARHACRCCPSPELLQGHTEAGQRIADLQTSGLHRDGSRHRYQRDKQTVFQSCRAACITAQAPEKIDHERWLPRDRPSMPSLRFADLSLQNHVLPNHAGALYRGSRTRARHDLSRLNPPIWKYFWHFGIARPLRYPAPAIAPK